MNRIVDEMKKVGVFFVATTDGDQPRVRPFSSVTEFEGNAYICTGNYKEFYRQVKANPKIELSGMYKEGTAWLRVSATLVEDERVEVQQAMLDDPTGPKGLYTAGDGRFTVFRLTEIKAVKASFFAPPEIIE